MPPFNIPCWPNFEAVAAQDAAALASQPAKKRPIRASAPDSASAAFGSAPLGLTASATDLDAFAALRELQSVSSSPTDATYVPLSRNAPRLSLA